MAFCRKEAVMNDTECIREIYRRYWEYMIRRDTGGLRSLMSEDYSLRHMTGVRQSAEEFLKGLADGTFSYYSAVHDSIEAEVNGDAAVLTGKSRVTAAVYGGGRHLWHLRGDFTLQRRNGKWELTGSEASTY